MPASATTTTRPARLLDEAALSALDAVAWPPGTGVVPTGDAPFFDDRHVPADHLVAERADIVVGYSRISRHMPMASNAHVLHCNGLAVSPAVRGEGIGSLLLTATVDEARARGARKLGLRVLSTNGRALTLYLRHGFVVEGRLVEEFRLEDGSYVDDLFLARALL